MCFIISLKWLQKFILDPLLYAIFGWTTLYGYRSKGKLLKWMSKCKGAGSKYACKKIMLCNILPMNEGNYCYFFFLFFLAVSGEKFEESAQLVRIICRGSFCHKLGGYIITYCLKYILNPNCTNV